MPTIRLTNLGKRLCSNEELTEQSDRAIKGYFEVSHTESVAEQVHSTVYYMPHQTVLLSAAATTKIRALLDASLHALEKHSLKHQLQKERNLVSELAQILL